MLARGDGAEQHPFGRVTSSAGGCTVCGISETADTLPGRPLWRAVLDRLWKLVPARARRYLAARFGDVSKSEAWGYAVWSAMGLVVGVPEIWAAVAGDDFVWPTISTTVGTSRAGGPSSRSSPSPSS